MKCRRLRNMLFIYLFYSGESKPKTGYFIEYFHNNDTLILNKFYLLNSISLRLAYENLIAFVHMRIINKIGITLSPLTPNQNYFR